MNILNKKTASHNSILTSYSFAKAVIAANAKNSRGFIVLTPAAISTVVEGAENKSAAVISSFGATDVIIVDQADSANESEVILIKELVEKGSIDGVRLSSLKLVIAATDNENFSSDNGISFEQSKLD